MAKGMQRVVTHLGAAVLSMGDLAALLVMEGPAIGGLESEAAYGEICMAWSGSHGVLLMSSGKSGWASTSSSPWGMTEGEKAAAEQTHAATTDVRITILAFRNETLVASSGHADNRT